MTRGVVFFDVDGTLIPGVSSSRHLAEYLGHAEVVDAAERAYLAGQVHNSHVAVCDARGWAGRTPSEITPWLDEVPLIDGIDESVRWCRAQDLLPVLATLAWSPVGEYLCRRFGFATCSGPRLEIVDGRYTGGVAEHLSEHGKRDFCLSVAAELGVSPLDCAAIGDSRSDLPLFAAVGFAIAFNGTAAARAAASVSVTGSDLRVVLPLLDVWLAQPHGKPGGERDAT